MKYIVLILCILASHLFAVAEWELSSPAYLVDSDNIEKYDTIKEKKFSPSTVKNFGYMNGSVWLKQTITNRTCTRLDLVVFNTRPRIDFIDIFVERDGKKEAVYHLGDSNPPNDLIIYSQYSSIELNLYPNESITLYIRHSNPNGIIDTKWNVSLKKEFNRQMFYDHTIRAFVIGILFFLLLYNSAIGISLRKKEFLYYGMMASVTLFGFMIFSGTAYLLDIGIPIVIFNTLDIFLYLFIIAFLFFNHIFFKLDTIEKYKNRHKYLAVLITIVFFIGHAMGISYNGIGLKVPILIAFAIILYILYISVVLTRKNKIKEGWFYIIGQGAFLLTLIMPLSTLIVKYDITYVQMYSFPFGIVIDFTFMTLALNIRLKQERKKSEKKEKMLFHLSRYDAIGMMTNIIMHQWKLPLSRIGALLNELEYSLLMKHDNATLLEEKIPQLMENVKYMREMINDYYYPEYETKMMINIAEELNFLKNNFKPFCKENNLTIAIKCEENLKILTYKNTLYHIFLILLNNTINACNNAKNIESQLLIEASQHADTTNISFKDNCGGINPILFNDIFQLSVSSEKDMGNGHGLGIVYSLVVEKLKGKIKIANVDGGTELTIEI